MKRATTMTMRRALLRALSVAALAFLAAPSTARQGAAFMAHPLTASAAGEPAASALASPVGGPMPSFGAPRLLHVPDAPGALLIGDFTGHGRPDIVVGGATEIDVLPNLGGGRFGAPIRTPFATGPGTLTRGVVAMAAGHIDGDNTLDLAVVSGAKVWVFYGNGHGHFRGPAPFAGHSYAPAGYPYQGPDLDAIAVAVLRHGHKPDLVVGEGSTPCCNGVGVEVFLNRGDGSFGAPRVYATGNTYNAATDVAVGDLTGDGVPDIAVLDNVGAFSSGSLAVLQGHGDGAFMPIGSASVEAGITSLVLDGAAPAPLTPLVYATGNPYYDGTQPSINILSGFSVPPPNTPIPFKQQRLGTTLQGAGAHPGGDPGTLAVAREPWGTLVVAVANRDQGTVGVRVGATPQSLGALQEFATSADPGAAPVAVALADLSGQGRLDLVAANAGAHTIALLSDDPSLPARAAALVGDWTSSGWTPGDPANNGPLKVQVAVTGTQFVATLLTGNAYIPAGQIELDGTYTGAPDFFVWVQFAAAGHKSVTWIYGQVGVQDTSHFTMTNTYNTAVVTFTRLSSGGSGGGGSGGGGAGSPPITCATIPPSQRSSFVVSYAGWRVTGSLSARAGLTVNDVTLLKTAGMPHDRYMAYRISIPYVTVQWKPGLVGLLHSLRTFRLAPDGTQYDHGAFVARTALVLGPRVCQTPADPHEAPYSAQTHPYFPLRPIDQFSIEADYRVWFDAHPTASSRYVTIEQLYKFYAPFDENNHDYDLAHGLACEPSQEIGGFLSEGGMRCARWKPLVFYFYHPGAGAPATLPLITVPYLLNFAPDHQSVQGAVFIHDCDRSEMLLGFRHGTCLTGEDPKDVTLADNHETVQQAISDGHPVFWDNVHMTDQRHVGAPVRPPGCAECVHIHWRWGTVTLGLLPWNDDPRAKLLYGDGEPLLCDDGHVNPTTDCHTDQSVDVALVNDRPGIESVTDFRQTVDGLPPGQLYGDGNLLGPYVNSTPKPNILFWYVASASNETQDTFFAHGGFFDAATP